MLLLVVCKRYTTCALNGPFCANCICNTSDGIWTQDSFFLLQSRSSVYTQTHIYTHTQIKLNTFCFMLLYLNITHKSIEVDYIKDFTCLTPMEKLK